MKKQLFFVVILLFVLLLVYFSINLLADLKNLGQKNTESFFTQIGLAPLVCSDIVPIISCPVLSNTDSTCFNNECIIASCAPGFCDANNDVLDGCEIACALQPALPIDLLGTFAPVGSKSSGQTSVNFVPNNLNPSQGKYYFTYSENNVPNAKYSLDTNNPNIQKGAIDIRDELNNFDVMKEGGVKKRIDNVDKSPLQVANLVTAYTFTHQLSGEVLVLSLSQTVSTNTGLQTSTLNYFIEIRGKTLIMRVHEVLPLSSMANNYYRGWTFNSALGVVNPVGFDIPYLEQIPITRTGSLGSEMFYSTYYDRSRSGSNGFISRLSGSATGTFKNSYDSQYITLEPTPEGFVGVLPFDETVYFTVSPDVKDVMLAVHSQPSIQRSQITDKVFFDNWRRETSSSLVGATSYAKTESLLQKLKDYGLDKLFVTYHFGQKHDRDCGYPDIFPVNNNLIPGSTIPSGGSIGLNSLIQFSQSLGFPFGMDITFDMIHYQHPNNIYYNLINFIARTVTGVYDPAWTNSGCISSPEGYTIAVNKRLQFAKDMALIAVQEGYLFTSLFIDVTPAKSFLSSLDYSYDNLYGRTLKQVYQNLKLLHKFQRQNFAGNGPVAGEGHKGDASATPFFVEEVTATEGEVELGENALVIPDFELTQITPHQIRQGMGYAGRWIGVTVPVNSWQVNYLHPDEQYTIFPVVSTPQKLNVNFDKYAATALAFGHSGMLQTTTFGASNSPTSLNYAGVPSPTLDNFINRWIEDYYTFQAIQSLYLSSSVSSIGYFDGVNFIDLNQAFKISGFDFTNVRLKIVYANGLELYVNRHQTSNWNVLVEGVTYYLPPNGWFAFHTPSNFLQYSALVDANGQPSSTGTRADYIRSNDYIFVDARGQTINFPGYNSQTIIANGVVVHKQNGDWKLTEQTGGTFSLILPSVPISPSNLVVANV